MKVNIPLGFTSNPVQFITDHLFCTLPPTYKLKPCAQTIACSVFYPLSALYVKLTWSSLPLPRSVHKLQEDVELEWLQQAEVLYYRLEHSHSKAVPQLKHNPWSLKCHQQHLQRMKENAKHRNQYSILSQDNYTVAVFFFFKDYLIWPTVPPGNLKNLHIVFFY